MSRADFTKDPEAVAALKLLSDRYRMQITLLPDGISEEFCMRLSNYVNFMLDTRILGPAILPAVQLGDGVACPYCLAPITAMHMNPADHSASCEYRAAFMRWALGEIKITRTLKAGH